jgi:hypothetical protein
MSRPHSSDLVLCQNSCSYPLFIRALKQRPARCSVHEDRPRAGAG